MRTAGSSSSATSAVTNGTMSANAGRNARSTTTHENSVPRPAVAVHASAPPHAGHAGSGYQHHRAARVAQRGMQELAARRAGEVAGGQLVVDVGERELGPRDRHVSGPS